MSRERPARVAFRAVVGTLTVQALILLAIGYLGQVHPFGDSVAVFRLQISGAVLAGAAILWLTGGRGLAAVAALAAMIAAVPILYGFSGLSAGTAGDLVFYQKNLFKKQMSRAELIHELETVDADVLTLQEISIYDHLNMKPFFAAYPHQLLCDSGSDYEIGLLSRFPIVPGTETCLTEERLAAAQIVMPDGNHRWLVSLHLGWPFPADQHEQAELVAKWLRTLDDPVMIGGDFNMVPWADSVRLIAKAAWAERVGPYRATFPDSGPLLPLPIDHIFLPSSAHARVEARPRAGSDHLGLVARFTP